MSKVKYNEYEPEQANSQGLTAAALKSGMIQSATIEDACVELYWDTRMNMYEVRADNSETNDLYARASLVEARQIYKAMIKKYINPIVIKNL